MVESVRVLWERRAKAAPFRLQRITEQSSKQQKCDVRHFGLTPACPLPDYRQGKNQHMRAIGKRNEIRAERKPLLKQITRELRMILSKEIAAAVREVERSK